MPDNLWTYFLGGTIVNQVVLKRVQDYEDRVHELFARENIVKHERHITIVPPFLASYQIASEINTKCAMASLLSTHPLTATRFFLQHLEIMSFEGLDILHFPIRVDERTPGAEMLFIDYVKTLRERFSTFGIKFKNKIPTEYKPHITVFTGENLRDSSGVCSMLRESKRQKPLLFYSGYPSLYTKCKEGWGDLSRDSNV